MNLVIVHLLPLPSAHEWRLSSLVINVSPEVLEIRLR